MFSISFFVRVAAVFTPDAHIGWLKNSQLRRNSGKRDEAGLPFRKWDGEIPGTGRISGGPI